ncbi:hypothetical protein JR316_0005012 [Psilocybe cubensis]|uniref:Uncharacterized protein n=2 Tax=Psilocybe cubensis TaxID=181762 RepID=A0ACB8H5I6_PSICU|nr:hypothetical protein JR316_0005012 [Psilocybe cubensis]KAH9482912.1 hypothetical protein JR316_0005012 [Psilocybe cubensis]
MLGVEMDAKFSPSNASFVLTSERLLAIPKRNLHDYLSAYIRDQRSFIKDYSADYRAEGGILLDTREPNDTLPSTFPVGDTSRDTVFGTPVLKARVATSSEIIKPKLNERSRAGSKTLGTTRWVTKAANGNLEGTLDLIDNKQSVSKDYGDTQTTVEFHNRESDIRKRVVKHTVTRDNNQDDEHIQRLEERRREKRARKVSMLPATGDKYSDDNPSTKRNDDRLKKKNQPKNTQLGFALLHGFSATNVGKNRLTLDPLSRGLGVFKKGKASTKTRVKGKKEGDDSGRLFSEAKFLNSRTSGSRKSPNVDDSRTSSTISSPSIRKYPRKHGNVYHEDVENGKGANSSKHSDEDLAGRRYNPDDSIIWDIEKDSDAMESETNSNDRQGTMLVNYNRHVATATKLKSPKKTASYVSRRSLESSDKPTGREIFPMYAAANELPSLTPSESASQLCFNQRTTHDRSKYFQCIEKLATPAHISSANTNSMLSVGLEGEESGTCNPKDTDGGSPKEIADDMRIFRTQDASSDIILSPTYLSRITCEFGPPEFDLPACCDLKAHTEDFPVFQLSSHGTYDLQDFQLQNILSEDVIDDTFLHPSLGDCLCNPDCLLCSNTNNGKASEAFDAPGYFLSCADHIVDHTPDVEHLHCRFCADPGNMELENYEEESSASNTHPDDYVNHDHSAGKALCPDKEEHQIEYFQQGRTLLYGHELFETRKLPKLSQLSSVEAEVAGALKLGHWLPHRL